jgi:hypothetical protein
MKYPIGILARIFSWSDINYYDKFTWNRESGSIVIYAYKYHKTYTTITFVLRIWPDLLGEGVDDSIMTKAWEILNIDDRNVLIMECRNGHKDIRHLAKLKLKIKCGIDILDDEHKVLVHKYIDSVMAGVVVCE